MTLIETITKDELIEEFDLFDDWEDKYRFIIELGDGLPTFDETARIEENRVQGCVSNVWLLPQVADDALLYFTADSDSQLVKGLIAIVIMLFSGKSAEAILQFDISDLFERVELTQHISRSRSNGLNSMIQRIKALALAQLHPES
ncbi:MAG: SufE family protein [Pirellulaceae bacterium]